MIKLLLMYGDESPSLSHIERLKGIGKDVCVVVADSEDVAIQHAKDTDAIIGHRYLRQTLSHTTQRLKWVQSTAAGPHHLLSPELRRINPVLTRCTVFSDIVAWHAFTLALAVIRRIPEANQMQQQGAWAHPSCFNLLSFPKTAMILGVGCIGKELASILRSNRMTVLGVTREYSLAAESACDELLCGDIDWRDHLQRVDLCFITLPLTKTTTHLFDETVLQTLPQHAVVINVGRGGVVDTGALIKLLREGHLGGAALDVVDPVPLPNDPIWHTPRLLITPKIAAFHPEYRKKLELFIENQVERYLNNETLLDIITINNLA